MTAAATVAITLVLLAVLLTGLSLHVSRLRLRHRVSFGDGGHKDLLAAMRAHGNCLEQSTLFGLLALAFALLAPGASTALTVCCALFLLARAVHAWALFTRRLPLRQGAHGLSLLAQIGLLILLLGHLR
ncbi:putative membrane protein YecN with MAPEG domain [Inhella inkyongensis]|uniref:Putative membrane protein YecN with MAPEG domain n=1 Tax=Inhella inkyongensis TaxID=392593 RepID=A0A840S047_9BURK|nr:MAPEG family protein [Inhella inkyongensis]MBB5202738.1 putative membrane protein YecN with MAPEG domain [Inhella inkyongensis]